MENAILLFLTCFVLGTNSRQIGTPLFTYSELDPKFVSSLFTDILQVCARENWLTNLESRVGLVPPGYFPEKLPINASTYYFNSLLLQGFHTQKSSHIEGLQTYRDDLSMNFEKEVTTIKYGLALDELALRGNYNLDLSVNVTRLLELIGVEPDDDPGLIIVKATDDPVYELVLKNLFFNVSLALNFSTESEIRSERSDVITGVETKLELGIDGARIFFDKLKVPGFDDGVPGDLWDIINGDLMDKILNVVQGLWVSLKPGAEELVNAALVNCTLAGIVGGDLSCLSDAIPSPTTTSTERHTAFWG